MSHAPIVALAPGQGAVATPGGIVVVHHQMDNTNSVVSQVHRDGSMAGEPQPNGIISAPRQDEWMSNSYYDLPLLR